MKILKAYKTELEPNNKQKSLFGRCAGASRFVYNWGLAEWKRQYEAGDKPSRYGLCKQFNAQKDVICPWIRELPYSISESAFSNLGTAFDNFFRRIKKGDEKAGYPKFKKRGRKSSFQIRNTKVEGGRVRITGAGWVRLKEQDYIPMDAARYGVYATISECAGRWFISVLVETEIIETTLPKTEPIGVDVGIKNLAVLSDGTFYENPKALYEGDRKLKRLQRELARRSKGGSNWRKTKEKLGKCYQKITNVRSNSLHNISRDVVDKNPGAIVIENLNVKGMVQNHHLAKAISDASFSELHRQLEYKAGWQGIDVLVADRWYASSKTCSRCGEKYDGLTLSDRTFECGNCGLVIDRDLNAAMNLAALAKAETQPDCLGS